MLLNIKIINGLDHSIEVAPDLSILNLKSLLATKLDIPPDQQRLMFKGKSMLGNIGKMLENWIM